jgi:hypothetical protein
MRFTDFVVPLALVASVVSASAARADVLTELPDPDNNWKGWYLAAPGLMDYNQGTDQLTMETGTGGVWFGSYGPGSSASGNAVSITARFAEGSRDWSTYLADGSYFAGMLFGPTGCDGNAQDCYGAPFTEGVSLSFANALNSNVTNDRFIDLDMQVEHQFGFLMKNGLVSYFIDGASYSGYAQSGGYNILVIGDGSGSTRTGFGAMTLSAARFDTAPEGEVILGVPEPTTWAMMICGFGMIGGALRSRRRRLAIA